MSNQPKPILTIEEALGRADRIIAAAAGDRLELRFSIARALVDAAFTGAEEMHDRMFSRIQDWTGEAR